VHLPDSSLLRTSLPAALARSTVVLTEGSVIERLRRNPGCTLDPYVAHAAFPCAPGPARILAKLYREYLDIAREARLPMLCFSPTWRANPERLRQARLTQDVNRDGVLFVRRIIAGYDGILLGGLMGCYGDAYRPEQALTTSEAAGFHSVQAKALAEAGCDFLIAATMPAASEAAGIAAAMAQTGAPYLLSFIINARGELLDSTPIPDALARIDASVSPAPLGYLVNCVHPSIMANALERCDPVSRKRVLGLQANTSAKNPQELEGSERLETEDPERFAESMVNLHRRFRLPILGGCCGTDSRHIRSLAARLVAL
jgi:homocysteine S-methyltransferase